MSVANKRILLTVQVKSSLKLKLEALAKAKRRTMENQAVCLIENALQVFEKGENGNFCSFFEECT